MYNNDIQQKSVHSVNAFYISINVTYELLCKFVYENVRILQINYETRYQESNKFYVFFHDFK